MTAQEFLQEWEKENNPFYPHECKWDRLKVNLFAKAYDDYKSEIKENNNIEEEIEKLILDWLKSDNENTTYIAHMISLLFPKSQKLPSTEINTPLTISKLKLCIKELQVCSQNQDVKTRIDDYQRAINKLEYSSLNTTLLTSGNVSEDEIIDMIIAEDKDFDIYYAQNSRCYLCGCKLTKWKIQEVEKEQRAVCVKCKE